MTTTSDSGQLRLALAYDALKDELDRLVHSIQKSSRVLDQVKRVLEAEMIEAQRRDTENA